MVIYLKEKMLSKKFISKPLKDQIESFTTFDFVIHATNILEKWFWMFICIGGTLWIGDIVLTQINFWNENPSFVTERTNDLSNLIAPTVTFCSNTMSEYSLIERMGNFIDPKKFDSKDYDLIRRKAIDVYVNKIYSWFDGCGFFSVFDNLGIKYIGNYQDACCHNEVNCRVYFIDMKNR